jgi:serine/threonine-protein kinase HipA
MSGRTAHVFLNQILVGELVEGEEGGIEFRLTSEYRNMARRPVLGQWFEDHLDANQRGDRPGILPAFFENLIPEGDLRLKLEERLSLAPGDDLGLLCAVGRDLPGAVVVQLQDGDAPVTPPSREENEDPEIGMRFSLAGVQLKFSMVRRGDRFCMPGRDGRGDWIAKIALDAYTELCANEWVTMEWARTTGFEVPATELRTLGDLVDVPHQGESTTQVFMIQRYDRVAAGNRIHQEDFQQIVGRRARGKYKDVTYEGLVRLAVQIVGKEAWPEMLRRLAFMVASGNDDAHMKNWSLVYPGAGIQARLSPLYDQVFTAQWPQFSITLALKLGGTKEFAAIDLGRFRELARRVGQRPEDADAVVNRTIAEAVSAWTMLRDHPAVSNGYREALQQHWRKVPLLKPHADAI